MKTTRLNIFLFAIILLSTSFTHKDLNEYGKWLKYYNLEDEDFKQVGADKQETFEWNPYDLTKEGAKEYSALFFYSPDSTYFLDLDSYDLILDKDSNGKLIWQGGDPEDKAQLVRTSDSSACTLLFFGACCNAETAIWRNKFLFEILGFTIDGNKFIPTIWKYDFSNKTCKVFESKKTFKAGQKSYLNEVRLKGINQKLISR